MDTIAPCARCGKVPELDPNDGYPIISCHDCYDGAPDSGTRSEYGTGLNSAEAIAAWNEAMEELRSMLSCDFCGADEGTYWRKKPNRMRERVCGQCGDDLDRGDAMTKRLGEQEVI